jgi:tetratricopeptide (TPR) repeat protein
MRKLTTILLAFLFLFAQNTKSQVNHKIDSLVSLLNKAVTDSARVMISGKLAEYYYIYQLDKSGDSILQKQLNIAEFTQNKYLIANALFGDAINNISNWRSKETFNRAILFLNKGLDYAKSTGNEDYIALAYTRIAALYRKRGQLENSFYNANIAFTSSLNIKSDSIKILATIELGDTYIAKGESLLAFKTYINAYDNAVSIKNITLQSEVLHRYSGLYQALGNREQAKENLLQSLELNRKNKNKEGLIKDYIDLARLTDERLFIEKAILSADSLNLEKYLIQAKRIMFGFYTYIIANSDSTLNYINSNPDLKQVFLNGGLSSYYWNLGSVFHYSNQPDSAIYYFNLAEPFFNRDYDIRTRQALYEEMGECYFMIQDYKQSINYYEKSLALIPQYNDPVKEARYTFSLSSLYSKLEDYKMAYQYSSRSAQLKDSLQNLSNQRDIALVEVNNEKRNHEKELEAQEERKLVKRNLQYMAITVALTIIFLVLIVIGTLPISPLTIKILGYFAFISLFEFLVLLIDNFLHRITHGEPLKIWLCKIILIALLVPVQHYLEHGMIKFLASKKLAKLKEKVSLKKWWQTKTPASSDIDEIEKDGAVL